jgi:DNA polymerase-3 subunit epsilon
MDAPEARELPQDLVFVDLETTGCNAAYHRITEIGIVRVEGGAAVEEWSTLVNPECLIPAYVENFTGITNQMVAAAPRFADIAHLVLEKLGAACAGAAPLFAAHNARFDYSFLRAEFRRAGVPFSAKVLCTVKLSRRLFPEHVRHNLDAVMERHGLACTARHRALGDARVISDFWLKLSRELPGPRLAAAAHSTLGRHKLPVYLPADLPDELPEGPGIYRLYGAGDELLYVGKSVSLRTGVLAHFAEDRTGSREQKLRAQVRRVDWVETAGELGALLREIECLRTLHPLYNRHLRAASDGFTVRLDEARGAAQILSVAEVDPAQLTECFGLFHSAKDARKALIDIAAARVLCLKLFGLEASDGSCFAYQSGKCRGACAGKELPAGAHGLGVAQVEGMAFPRTRGLMRARPDGWCRFARFRSLDLSRQRALRGGASPPRRTGRTGRIRCARVSGPGPLPCEPSETRLARSRGAPAPAHARVGIRRD